MSAPLTNVQQDNYERPNQSWQDDPVAATAFDSEETLTIQRRSLRFRRSICTVAMTVFTIGTLLIVFNSPFRNEFIVPGPLASSHAQILAGQGADRCAACHDAARFSFSNWVKDAFSRGKVASKCQSELCMECHQNSINKDFALNPHNLDPSDLSKKTSQFKNVSFDARMVFRPPVKNNELACSACHREHHGNSDLSALTDHQCQSCHANNFHSFETDHPEFTQWPISRRQRIAFDHTSHSLKHFPGKEKTFDCAQCHVDDGHKNIKLLASYEKSCSECHHEQLVESGKDGLAIFALPMLDLEAIRDAGGDVGQWPEHATGDFDGKLPPIMRLLLTADDRAAKLLAQFDSDFDFADIDPVDTEQVLKASKLVWSIKYLLHDLSVEGADAVQRRLEMTLDREISSQQLAYLASDLDHSVFQVAVRRWLPKLSVEVTNHRLGAITEIGWLPEGILAFQKVDDETLATNPLSGLVQPLNTNSQPSESLPKIKHPTPQAAPLQKTESKPAHDAVIRNQHVFEDDNDPNLLVPNPLTALLNADRTDNAPSIRPQNPVAVETAPFPAGSTTKSPTSPTGTSQNPAIDVIRRAIPVVAQGGWFRDDTVFRISYRPGGHADRCLQGWTDLITRVPDANLRMETAPLFDQLTKSLGVGMCRNCHTVDQLDDDSFSVNWRPVFRDLTRREFTRFSHGPHLIQPSLQDCSHCHELDESQVSSHSFVDFDPSNAISNFKPVVKDNCTSCHREGHTNNGCTQCHNYHVGSFVIGTNQ